MASTSIAPFYHPIPQPPLHSSESPKFSHKSHRNLHFLFNSSPNPLLLNPFLKPPSRPLLLLPLSDSVRETTFLDNLELSSNLLIPTASTSTAAHEFSQIELRPRLFLKDPPWVTSLFFKGLYKKTELEVKLENRNIERRRHNMLRRRQVEAETEQWEKTVEEYRQMERQMREKNLAPNLPGVKSLLLGWFEPLKEAIAAEQRTQQAKPKRWRTSYGPYIDLLPVDKMAIIVMHKMLGLLMAEHEGGCVRVVQAAIHVGSAIEQEVRIHYFLEKTKRKRKKVVDDIQEDPSIEKENKRLRKHVTSLIKKKRMAQVQKLVKDKEVKPWGRDIQAKVGSRLIELLIETAYIQYPAQSKDGPPDLRPAFWHLHKTITTPLGGKSPRKYGVIECDPIILTYVDGTANHTMIPYMPMLVPPRKWKGYDNGAYFFLPSYAMRTHGSRKQRDAVKNAGTRLQRVYEALDILGSTKWRVNRRILSVVESLWDKGGNVAGLVDREDVRIPEKPLTDDFEEIQKWKFSKRNAKKTNQERHSLRCDTELKLSVARKYKDEEGFYYPHNLDFRGRAYPMHPHLNHLSSDLCRGVLEFAEGRPLGKSGIHWLKIQLANLYAGGVEKLSYDGRLAFVENHLDDIFDSADYPVNGNRWWLTAEDPFQCLATCINLSEALRSSSPHTVISHLPIHQDGSCNGLQHYAALGRDSSEAAAVNLVAADKPSDVYSEIAARVHIIMERDSKKDPHKYPNALLAKALIGQVDRKLVKQTVMTSVYGVTYVGARTQIKKRLREKGLISDDKLLYTASCYAAKVTMAAIGDIFQAARGIMGWLGDCAKVIAAGNQPVQWTTPLGLPVLQPYCKARRHSVRTTLQVLTLRIEGDSVEHRKQRTAFPPNFVHSLDGTHMMMTATACRDAGLLFAGVHDSFWTHACDVDTMNRILREKFVELYDQPVLENLLESFQASYPDLEFPPLPDRGNFDLHEVLKSPYFFN